MKKNLLTLIIIGIYFIGNSQTVNNYSGVFETRNLEGKATYQYLTENNERVFNGPFNFASNDLSFKTSGNFNKNLKDGEWKTILKNLNYKGIANNILIDAEINGNYKDGKRNGIWNIQKTKIYTPSKNGITQYYQANADILSYLLNGETQKESKTIKIIEKLETSFKENHFSGDYEHNVNDRLKITGKFNSIGNCVDSWKVDYFENNIQHKIEIIFQNGVISKVTDLNLSTGENLDTYQNDFNLEKFFSNYDLVKNISIIDDKAYSLKPIAFIPTYYKIEILKELLDNWNKSTLEEGYFLKEIDKGNVNETLSPIKEIYLNEEETEVLINLKEIEKEELRRKEYQQREKERNDKLVLQKNIENFNRSSVGQIQNEIQSHFDDWTKKGEFETKEQHTQRLASLSKQELDKIENLIIVQNKDKFLRKSYRVQFDNYNTEGQFFNLKENINGKHISVPIPLKLAKNLKEKILQESSTFNSFIYFIPIDAEINDNDWVISKAIVIFDFITQQLQGEPKQYFSFNQDDKYYFKYEALRRNGRIYPVSKTGYVKEGSMTKISLVDIQSIDELSRKDKFLYTIWKSNELNENSLKFDYEILNEKLNISRK